MNSNKINKKKISKIKIKIKAKRNKRKIYKSHLSDNVEIKKLCKYILKKPIVAFKRFKNSQNRIQYILRILLSSRVAIILLFLILMAKTMAFHSNIETKEIYNDFIPKFFSYFALVLIFPLLFVKKDKNRFRFIMFYNIFYSILLFADNVYWKYSANFLSCSQISYIKYAEEIGVTIGNLLEPSQFIYFIDIPIIFALWYIARRPINKKKSKFVKNRGKRRLGIAIIYTIIIFYIMTPIIKFFYAGLNEYSYNKLTQVRLGTILGYHCLDVYNSLNIESTTKYKTYNEMIKDYNELKKYKDEHFKKEDIYGIAKGKNVIVLQLESIQNFLAYKTINGKEITPNLNKFLEENIEISKMIVQSYSTTADSEYSAITSLYPLENGQVFSAYFSSINNDIFRLYKEAGYHTSYMHGNVGNFWNRKSVFNRLSIDNLSFVNDFDDTSELIYNYLSDELFYKQAVQKLQNYKEPFFTFLTAASSHTSFELYGIQNKDEKISIDVGKYSDTLFGRYLEAANYADYAFGILIDSLKNAGLYDDSVILIFGDHYGPTIDDPEMKDFIKQFDSNYNDIKNKINYVNVLCGIKIPGMEKRKIDSPVSKIDIKPTLLHLSGIEDDFSLGETIFSTKDYAYINNGHIVTNKYYYYDNEWYFIDTGDLLDLNTLDNDVRKKLQEYVTNISTELDVSYSVPINNLLQGH